MTCSAVPVRFAGSPLSTPLPRVAGTTRRSGAPRPRCPQRRALRHQHALRAAAAPAMPLLLSAVLVLVAQLVAPEQPRAQEAICHRHNGEAACRVW